MNAVQTIPTTQPPPSQSSQNWTLPTADQPPDDEWLEEICWNRGATSEKERILRTTDYQPRTQSYFGSGLVAPLELRSLDRWCWWWWDLRNGRWTKRPTRAGSQEDLDLNDPAALVSADALKNSMESFDDTGFSGFVFQDGDPFVTIDLSDTLDARTSCFISEEAREVVSRFATYTELSATGTGLKLFLRGDLRSIINRGWARERNYAVYGCQRFCPMVGRPFERRVDVPDLPIRDAQAELEWFVKTYLPAAMPGAAV